MQNHKPNEKFPLGKDAIMPCAQWDTWAWNITLVVGILLILISLTLLPYSIWSLFQSDEPITIHLIVPILLPIILGVTILFAPLRYSIKQGNITIHRFGPNIVISLKDIVAVEPIDTLSALRIFGSGGFFGYYGWFFNGELGVFKAYATNRHSAILITLVGDKKIVVSPDRPTEFMQLIIAMSD